MGKLSRKLLRPFKRSAETESENGQGSVVATETPGGVSHIKDQTNREKHGLFELVSATSDDDFSVDIVAVHGLSGDWESTWTDPESQNLWLRDFLPLQFPNIKLRIWSFGYDSATAFTNSVANIDDAAKALVNALDGERQTENSRKKPIIFVAHSLGGIIVKRAMNLANERSDLWRDIVDSVFSIVFFAVPHRGADAASLATVAANVYSFATLGFVGNTNFVEALKRNSPEFWQISNAFIQPASKVGIIRSFYETTKIANHLIVDEDSASLRLSNERAIPIQGANHRDICKFFSDGSQKYRPVRNAMRDIIQAASGAVTSDNGESAYLDTLRFPHMLEGPKSKHDSKQHQWLFHNSTFQNWIRNREATSNSRLLWITGTPGSGKSTAMQGAYYRLLEEKDVIEEKHYVAAFFFQDNEEPLRRNTSGMYRALLYQILSRQRRTIAAVIKAHGFSMKTDGAYYRRYSIHDHRELLLYVLREICQRGERTTILIDAVDECLDGDRGDWEKFFHDVVVLDEFKSLNICLSSRHFGSARWLWLRPPRICKARESVSKLQTPVVEVEVENHDAIRTYLDERLCVYSRETEEVASIKERILAMSSGVFLWVEEIVGRLIEDLRSTSRRELRLQPTPKSLKKLYEDALCTAQDPMKTWRLLHWLLMAADLSLGAWRDLIPFLEEKTPRSLKRSGKSVDWAEGSTALGQDDSWIMDLRQIVCRISVGLADVATVSDGNNRRVAGDQHSIIGEAGSWNTADGDKRLVRPVHSSLRRFLQDEGGFDILRPALHDHYGKGLIMAMKTCLDFIKAREFSRLGLTSHENQNTSGCEKGTAPLISDGDASARTSIESFSSARSIHHNAAHHRITSMSYSSTSSLSTGELGFFDGHHRTTVLARLSQEANHYSESPHEKEQRIERWREFVGGHGHSVSESSPSIGFSESRRSSIRHLRKESWSSDLLSYLLTAFPEFAQSAEKAGIDATPIIMGLREGGFWRRWLNLSDHMGSNITLKQWAQSQQLHTWTRYLPDVESSTVPDALKSKRPRPRPWTGFDMNLNYCFDCGDRFVKQSDMLDSCRPACPSRYITAPDVLLAKLKDELLKSISQTPPCEAIGARILDFIPYKLLRGILTETIVAELLGQATNLDQTKAQEVRESCARVLGILILIGRVEYIADLVEAAVNDTWLPLKESPDSHHENMTLVSHLHSKGRSVLKGLTTLERTSFQEQQWLFLSPFLARPAGQLQHYNLRSSRHPMPIIEWDKDWCRRQTGRIEQDIGEAVRFHQDCYEFGDSSGQAETASTTRWFLLKSLRGLTWERFLSIVNASRFVSEMESQESAVLPILCTLEHPSRGSPSKSDYYIVFPLPQGGLQRLFGVDPTRYTQSCQLTERWLLSQCSRMAASLAAIHQIASLKTPHLPRFLFLRSGRLAADMIYWVSSSDSQLGTLVFANLFGDPPRPYESPPEYLAVMKIQSQSKRSKDWSPDSLPYSMDERAERLYSINSTVDVPVSVTRRLSFPLRAERLYSINYTADVPVSVTRRLSFPSRAQSMPESGIFRKPVCNDDYCHNHIRVSPSRSRSLDCKIFNNFNQDPSGKPQSLGLNIIDDFSQTPPGQSQSLHLNIFSNFNQDHLGQPQSLDLEVINNSDQDLTGQSQSLNLDVINNSDQDPTGQSQSLDFDVIDNSDQVPPYQWDSDVFDTSNYTVFDNDHVFDIDHVFNNHNDFGTYDFDQSSQLQSLDLDVFNNQDQAPRSRSFDLVISNADEDLQVFHGPINAFADPQPAQAPTALSIGADIDSSMAFAPSPLLQHDSNPGRLRDQSRYTEKDALVSPTRLSSPRGRRQSRPGKVSASKFHVWCLGVIWLQLITWSILGPEEMQSSETASIFDQDSIRASLGSGFYDVVNGSYYRLKPVVMKLIDKLQRHEGCTMPVSQLLKFIQDRMLVIDPAVRASSQEVREELSAMKREFENLEKTAEEVVAA